MSQLDNIPPHLRMRSISPREIVLPLADALEAIDYLESRSALILGWEGWVKAADGRVGHGSAGYLSTFTEHLSVAEAATDARKTIQAGALDWQEKHGGGTDALHFCITVRLPG
ncbi:MULTISPECIES: hypothetical protein [Lysobacteraceae]|uniref:hypothetical protein n=1 Tax=Lysobacteraceae TaxID=32033 RepID=UPI001BD04696|nr:MULTISPECIES: hypothetical protein [Lysobacter]